jgi:hypothetical protein
MWLRVVEWGQSLIHALTIEVLVEVCPIVLQFGYIFSNFGTSRIEFVMSVFCNDCMYLKLR